tara:strand:+ start:1056 stop:1235 length:180 start_codon:yes stop_codon:yes gene_type:complete
VRKLATLVGRNSAKNNTTLAHKIIGKILSLGTVGNKYAVTDPNPFIVINANNIITNLFI